MLERDADIRPTLDEFASLMEAKLRQNNHKPHWRTCDLDYLFGRLIQETLELKEAIKEGNTDSIRDEAADVANFAMFVSDVAKRKELSAWFGS